VICDNLGEIGLIELCYAHLFCSVKSPISRARYLPPASAQLHPDYTFRVVLFIKLSHYTENMANYSEIQVPFDSPSPYRIMIQGQVAPSWSDRLQGMDIRQTASDSGNTISTLTGELPDQTALAGVLNTLHELHLSVLSVECLKVA
jgi:hypothetical protein